MNRRNRSYVYIAKTATLVPAAIIPLSPDEVYNSFGSCRHMGRGKRPVAPGGQAADADMCTPSGDIQPYLLHFISLCHGPIPSVRSPPTAPSPPVCAAAYPRHPGRQRGHVRPREEGCPAVFHPHRAASGVPGSVRGRPSSPPR